MSRNGSGVYSLPAGSTVTNGDTSDATDLNTPLADIEADLNIARPIVAGGTGATSAAQALINLGLTATAAELNTLDGITATVTELNYTDGVTSAIQTQLDAKRTVGTVSATFVAGTDAQGQGPIPSTDGMVVVVTTAANPSGVTLPVPVSGENGKQIVIFNRGTNPIKVYPSSGTSLQVGTADIPLKLEIGFVMRIEQRSTTAWLCSIQPASFDTVGGRVLGTNAAGDAVDWVRPGYTWLAPQSTASGSGPFDFTGIPSGVAEIVVAFSSVSLSGTDSFLIQIGDSGGFETTGYSGSGSAAQASAISTSAGPTNGFGFTAGNAANAAIGFVSLIRPFGDNEWLSNVNMGLGAQHTWAAQTKTLSDTLTQVRITRTGSNTFDGGRVSVGYR